MSQKFACSLMSSLSVGGVIAPNHTVCIVEASNEYEASGKGMAIALKIYPLEQGWGRHHVVTCPETNILDPAEPIKRTAVN